MSVGNSTHIWIDDRGVAWIDQTNLKVIEIALERLAHGSSVEEIVDQHKGLITLAQVHAALAHYYDYQDEFDTEIESLSRAAIVSGRTGRPAAAAKFFTIRRKLCSQ